jgi:agmatinase
MNIQAVVFPFDLFGSAGTAAGAQLLGDAIQEMIDDAERETQPARSQSYRNCVDLVEFPFDTLEEISGWRATGRETISAALEEADFTLWLTGNHLGALPIYETLGPDDLILQFDAHLDAYNLADSTTELSHGNFLLHLPPGKHPRVVNIGSRDLFLPDQHSLQHFHDILTAELLTSAPDKALAKLNALTKKAKRIWIDIDCDAFDPAYFPAVPLQLPFGLAPREVLRILQSIWSKKVVGISFSEFDPGRDRNDLSLGTLIWLMEWCLLTITEK